MNLIDDAWIPVIRNEQADTIALREISDPSVTAIHGLPADLHIGLLEMLIAMVTMAMTRPDIDDWHDLLENPPTKKYLETVFSPYRSAFNLLGDGPRFMQMPCPQTPADMKKASPISTLMWGSAGKNTAEKNLDTVVHRDDTASLSPGLAAIALYSDLTRIQGSGQGHLSNIRKSNHVTFLVDLADRYPAAPLWATIWGNVPCLEQGPLSPNSMQDALPWMRQAAIDSSVADLGNASKQTKRSDIESYFATPRRIWLLEDEHGNVDRVLSKNKGLKYDDSEWSHPHSPFVRVKTSKSKEAPAPYKVAAERFPRLGAYELASHSTAQASGVSNPKEDAEFVIPAIHRAKMEIEQAGPDLQIIVAHQLADNAEMMALSLDLGTKLPGNPAEAVALIEFDRVTKRAYGTLKDVATNLLDGKKEKDIPKLNSAFSCEQALIQFADRTKARFRSLSMQDMATPEALRSWATFVAFTAQNIFQEMFFEAALNGTPKQNIALQEQTRFLRKLFPEKDRQTDTPQEAPADAST